MARHSPIVKHARTDADVQRLMAVFGDVLPDGRVIPHADVEVAIGLDRAAARYRTVTAIWRRVLFAERRVFLDGRGAEGAGFLALTPDAMVRYANREVRASGRKLKKALAVASAPDDADLSPSMLQYRRRLESATLRIAQEHRRNLEALTQALRPQPVLPRATADATV